MNKLTPTFSSSDCSIDTVETCFQGFFQMNKLHFRHALFNGGESPLLARERFDRGPAVGVLLYDEKKDIVVLIEQFRVGALEEPRPWIFEVVAGMIEPGETPESVAHRETLEETGGQPQELIHMCDYLVSPGGTDEKLYLYLAKVDSDPISGVHGLAEEGEDIKVHKISSKAAFEGVANGSINNGATVIAIQWLEIQLLKRALGQPNQLDSPSSQGAD